MLNILFAIGHCDKWGMQTSLPLEVTQSKVQCKMLWDLLITIKWTSLETFPSAFTTVQENRPLSSSEATLIIKLPLSATWYLSEMVESIIPFWLVQRCSPIGMASYEQFIITLLPTATVTFCGGLVNSGGPVKTKKIIIALYYKMWPLSELVMRFQKLSKYK